MRSILGRNFLWIQSQGGEYPSQRYCQRFSPVGTFAPQPSPSDRKEIQPFSFHK